MNRKIIITAAAIAMVAVGAGLMSATEVQAQAQTPISAAIAAGQVGEQADGYMGLVGSAASGLKALVDDINIKRRALYTDLAAKRGVTVADAAAATGCQTLATRVKPGQMYRIGDGDWQRKGDAAIVLPSYCATAG